MCVFKFSIAIILTQLTTLEKEVNKMKYLCKVCGYIYDEEKEGTKFEELPPDWLCPVCAAPKEDFAEVL